MDLMSIVQREQKVGLLTLPRSDLKDASSDAAAAAAAANDNANDNDNDSKENAVPAPKQLVLMQLPKGMTMSDLISGCHLTAPRTSAATSASTAQQSNNYNASDRQASLVLESKNKSYSISKLETSNVLVLVPPVVEDISSTTTTTTTTTTLMNEHENDAQDNNHNASPNKRPKVDTNDDYETTTTNNNTVLLPVPVRLLQMGGSGASFLELKRKMLRPGDLLQLLQQHVFDPYNLNRHRATTHNPYSNNKSNSNNNKSSATLRGRTLESLALELQCSQGQVQAALPMVQGFSIPSETAESDNTNNNNSSSSPKRYGLLSEEALQEAQKGIIATLAEEFDQFGDYADKGVNLKEFVPQVLSRLTVNQPYPELEHVIRFALTTLMTTTTTTTTSNDSAADAIESGTVQLNVAKIAVCLAHRLFQSQTAPWEEKRFCLRWQSELPGVGNAYQTSLDMLRGVALPFDASHQQTPLKSPAANSETAETGGGIVWKYFPANKLPLQPELRFPALFNFKDQWTLKELEPYLESLVLETNLTQAELLLQYTSNSPGVDEDGNAVKVYSFKLL